ncbi:DUF1659 domain-containing protein [Clostridium butyricum]|uniref:DUF1659 domain-containing protein n=1 Tax=Clostridium butyricum TaxID=1492 RepID=A0A0A6PTJ0_CLOBU|nr:DUF1659 domain-containing protein [Clostridium butyricum]KHD13718.1 hypothetical protein OA81_19275 [Clostridium butyricum]KHD15704.1 hypothetical protein OA81_07660 [Clostridium butyricum]PPV12134.1 hypothetical protein AWN73_19860 [Clostridium butyricum]
MAVTKIPESKSMSIEVRKGTDALGNATYSKKNFSGIKTDADPANVLAVDNAICEVVAAESRDCFLNTVESLVEA